MNNKKISKYLKKALLSLILASAVAFNSGCGVMEFADYLLSDEDYRGEDYTGNGGSGTDNSHGNGSTSHGAAGEGGGAAGEGSAAGGPTGGVISSEGSGMLSLTESGAVRDKVVRLKGNGEDTVTILVYMNGSDLESDSGEASIDLSEMVKAGSSDKVNILVQTMGTRKWTNYGIASNRSQIYSVSGDGLTLVRDDLGQLDCTAPDALSDFILWGKANYPANRYILLFWNHGGGPVYGFGYDEWNPDEYAALTIDEMQKALSKGGVFFDFIGMDCCIMSCLEVCAALYDYCDYMVLSEDFESGLGWHYTPWLQALYANTSIPTPELGKLITDSMVGANASDTYEGDDSILAVIDESMLKVLWQAWMDFAYANEEALLGSNFSREVTRRNDGRVLPRLKKSFWDDFSFSDFYADDETSMSEYYITDIMAVASNLRTEESEALRAALSSAIVYMSATEGDADLTGLSVTLPYGDRTFYSDLRTIFTNCGFDGDYIAWLEKFSETGGYDNYYDYSDWEDSWDGWDSYDDSYDWGDWSYFGDGYDSFWDSWGSYDGDYDDGYYDSYYDEYGDYDDDSYDGYYGDYDDDSYDGYYDDYDEGYYDDGYYDDECYEGYDDDYEDYGDGFGWNLWDIVGG